MKFTYIVSLLLAGSMALQCGNRIDQKEAGKHFKTGNAAHRKGLKLYDQRKFDQARPLFLEAIKSYESAVKYYPKYGSVYLTIGDTYLKLKNYPRAADAFKKPWNLSRTMTRPTAAWDSLIYRVENTKILQKPMKIQSNWLPISRKIISTAPSPIKC